MDEAVTTLPQTGGFVEHGGGHRGCVSRLSCQVVVANIETGKLEHGNGTVEEPVGQPLMKWHRGKAGLGCSWIIRVLTGGR